MPDVLVVSVPHTGTHFINDLLARHGVKYQQVHTDTFIGVRQVQQGTHRIVCAPLRHPEKCWKTWCVRGFGGNYLTAWKHLDYIAGQYKVWFLPVDTEDRDEYLGTLAHAVRAPLSTDWEPVGRTTPEQFRHEPRPPNPHDIAEVMALPVVRRFY